MVTRIVGFVMVGFFAACGGGGNEADTSTAETTTATDTSTPPDVGPPTVACCPLGNCGSTTECVDGACLPQTGPNQCYFDGECPQGATCEGETLCQCGVELASCAAQPGTCRYPSGCCNGDNDCTGADVCIAGKCRAGGAAGSCWRDDQCPSGQDCDGATTCACGDTSCTDHIGACGAAGICCLSDVECGDGLCRGGRCVAPAADGHCWRAEDCTEAGSVCAGLNLCECKPGASDDRDCVVPSTPGTCAVAPHCTSDSDCANDEVCVDGKACAKAPNRSPTKDECWIDAHCGIGRTCEKATLCEAGDASCTPKIGRCTTDVIACENGAACPIGMRCIAPDSLACVADLPVPELDMTGLYPSHVCVAEVDRDDGQCWQTSDCGSANLRCGAEEVCVDPEGCDRPNTPGQCREHVEIRNCCDSHTDCEAGTECRNNDASITCPPGEGAVCLPIPEFGESCWNLYDCPDGKTCQRTMICGCNGKCRWNNMGICLQPTYCDTDLDCGTDSVCAHDTECILSPCTTASTCPIGGRCQLKAFDDEGKPLCWNHEECAEGEYCDGLRVCPADKVCVAPDVPGQCKPRGELGDCCSSLRGCEPGLRCLSPILHNGCAADFSSVCVPYLTPGNSCYGDNDCDAGQHCEGEIICPCGVEDCTSPPQAGECVIDN